MTESTYSRVRSYIPSRRCTSSSSNSRKRLRIASSFAPSPMASARPSSRMRGRVTAMTAPFVGPSRTLAALHRSLIPDLRYAHGVWPGLASRVAFQPGPMTDAVPTPAYVAALRSYLRGAEESALLWAYEYGREILEAGGGVLELGAVHRDAVASLLEGARDGEEAAHIHRSAWAFLAETIAPVEMALRGYQQSNDALRALAATLDEQVRERTRDLDESLEELKRADAARR